MVERRVRDAEAASSSLVASTKKERYRKAVPFFFGRDHKFYTLRPESHGAALLRAFGMEEARKRHVMSFSTALYRRHPLVASRIGEGRSSVSRGGRKQSSAVFFLILMKKPCGIRVSDVMPEKNRFIVVEKYGVW